LFTHKNYPKHHKNFSPENVHLQVNHPPAHTTPFSQPKSTLDKNKSERAPKNVPKFIPKMEKKVVQTTIKVFKLFGSETFK